MEDSTLLQERRGDCLVLTLNRTRKANAIGLVMSTKLQDALSWAARDPAIAGVLLRSSSDRVFSAGMEIVDPTSAEAPQVSQAMKDLVIAITCFSKPLLVAASGAAVGGGAMLALLADRLVMADTAYLSLPEIDLGLPSPVGFTIARHRLGDRMAAEMILHARRISAADAAGLGIATAVPAATLDQVAIDLLIPMMAKPQLAYSMMKAHINDMLREEIERAALLNDRMKAALKQQPGTGQ